MNSATSIEKQGFRLKPEATGGGAGRLPQAGRSGDADQAQEDAGFKPWHFFVLASLMLATVAVVMSRQGTPEHLVLVSFTIGAAGAAAAGFYRMLAPLATDDVSVFREPLTERSRATLEHEKTLVLRSIKELEFDKAMGKLSDRDFEEMGARLRARAISLMKELDREGTGYRELIERELKARLGPSHASAAVVAAPQPAAAAAAVAAGLCGACGTGNDPDATFCKRCGTRLAAAGE
jgi:hypothetical protein